MKDEDESLFIYWLKWPPSPKWGYVIRLQGCVKIEQEIW
jgi:hypothetical protein